MQQIIKKLPPKISVRRSTRKSELQTKEFVLTVGCWWVAGNRQSSPTDGNWKGVRNVSSRRVGATTPPTTSCSHRATAVRHFNPPPPPPSSYRRHVNKCGKLIANLWSVWGSRECTSKPWKGCPENGTRYIGGRKWDNDQRKRLSWFFWVVLP